MSAFARAGRRAAIARELAPVVAVVALARARRRVALALALAWLARAVVARATARRGPARALRGRAVWITGASQGLGEATARACARLGARVVVSGRRAERCAEVAEECARLGAASAKCVVFDVCGTRSELSEACERAFEAAGGTVDVFVNAAGGSQACSALAGDDEDVDKALFQLNAIGAISLTKEVAKRMVAAARRRKAGSIAPKIVGVCSVASKVPAPGQSVYAAAKSAYAAFLNSLRSEIANTGVKVVCVYPGPIATGMNGQERVIFRKNMADSTPSPSASKTAISRTAARPPSTKGRMNVDYVAARIVRSTLADVDELVLAPQPIMALTYCVRFFPTLAYAALDVIGPKRARRADAGENMYDLLEKTREILESIGDVDSKDSKGKLA